MQLKKCISQCLCVIGTCIFLPQAIGTFVRKFAVMGMDREEEIARKLALIAVLYSGKL
jgi:hypothetical protein